MQKKVYFFSAIIIAVSIISLTYTNTFSYPGGIAGRTKKSSSSGCGSCHTQNSNITGFITTPDSVRAGQTYTFTLTINMSSGSGGYGVDIAAKNGTLAVVSGSGLKLSSSELVHSSAISYSNPKVISFSYTAPSTAGTDTIYATIDRGYSGAYNWTPNKGFKVYVLSGIANNETPQNFYLSQNFPNPFNPVTKITYGVAKASDVKVTVYDMLGKQVASLVNEYQNAGNYFVNFDAAKYASGIYYYKIEAGDFTEIKKMSLIK